MKKIIILVLLLCVGCKENTEKKESVQRIMRHSSERLIEPISLKKKEIEKYPWEKKPQQNLVKITKDFFRCKGSLMHPLRMTSESLQLNDCKGANGHFLPIIHGEENVYPILIDLMNYLQKNLKKRVIITCGHRCMEHHRYADLEQKQAASKHLIGAEVDFYVQGMEQEPMKVIEAIFAFYRQTPGYMHKEEYEKFERYDGPTDVSTKPWINKEIAVKLYNGKEGRDFDNRHPYPYICIQVRFDRDLQEKVVYTWEKAHQNLSK